ncbi:DUF748 domain-containing protein [Pseudorhodoferax sp. Leaf267]|uniref:DUF748 domain-containing protein n=1 Tax=Pseudorhodoferax sp. Leaf267 TaxID=1736316 RepID=UPI001F2779A8|nr:DUF748 domain-containing protein [Pseudorhodoferax sp. Leaf267]
MRTGLLHRIPAWLRRTGYVVLGLAFFWSMALWWLPALLKPQAERAIEQALGRRASIGAVEFRPWTLELTLSDFVLHGQDGRSEQVRVGQLYANLALQSVLRLGPVIQALHVGQPHVNLTQQSAGHYDIDDILARLAAPQNTPPGKPLPFAISNVTLSGGEVDVHDAVVGKTHTVRSLELGIPFLSNLPAYVETETQPRLAFSLNGSAFDSAAQSTPFVDSRRTQASLKVARLDLQPYLSYLPSGLPMQLQAGVVDAELHLRFVQTPKPSVVLDGHLALQDLRAADPGGKDLLQIEHVALDIAELRPLERLVRLSSLDVVAPRLQVRRDAAGRLNLAPRAAETAQPVPAPEAAPAPAWTVTLGKAGLKGGRVGWTDAAASPSGAPAELALDQLELTLEDLQWPFTRPLRLSGSTRVAGAGTAQQAAPSPAVLTFSGGATDRSADVQLTVEHAGLDLAAPYLAGVLKPGLQGDLSAELALAWQADAGLVVDAERVTLGQLALGTPSARGRNAQATVDSQEASIRKLELRKARVDVARQAVDIGVLSVDRPRLAVARDSTGRWMFEPWLVPAATPAATSAPAKPWTVTLDSLELDDGALAFADQATARPVALGVSGLRVRARGLRSDRMAQPSALELSAAVASAQTAPGQITFKGQLAMQPLVAQGEVDTRQLPLHALEPYFGNALNLQIARADTSFKGKVRYAAQAGGPALQLAGDLGVEDFRSQQRGGATPGGAGGRRDLLTWNALRLRGLAVDMAPGSVTSVAVQQTSLSDFYARVIVDESGRINLQDLVKAEASAPAAPAAPASVAAAAQTAGPSIRFGPIEVQNGRVLFSDRFVKPNYTANLTELRGRLSAFDSAGVAGGSPALADLELRGRAEGTASLEITGKLNPLAKPLALDIYAKVRDLELPPLSPYSVKYAGHGIERGKLSVDLHYEVLPNGQLTASNSLVLNQLTFGNPVPGAPASLPVRLATALLADRNGVIDLNLPIQGSLNDPQFSLGPVILKIIGNLILKAVTSPFSLLASAFGGGGEELGRVEFKPGSAALDQEAEKRLDKVATALTDRPALKLSVVGSANLDAERVGMQRERLQRMLQAEKRRRDVAAGQSIPSGAPGQAPVPIGDDEYPELLKAVYQRAELDKPRNALGLAKDIPGAEMEALLIASMQLSDDAARNLAVQRGVAVRDYLASKQVPLERLFLGAPKTLPADAAGPPRADLELATP